MLVITTAERGLGLVCIVRAAALINNPILTVVSRHRYLLLADSVLDEEPPFEMRYSIETPEPTPPSSPPQAVSVQTSLTEQVLQTKVCCMVSAMNDCHLCKL